GRETTYEVTGVIEDIPQRTQFNFDFLITHAPTEPDEFWQVPDCLTYILMEDNTGPNKLVGKLMNALNEVPQLKSTNRTVAISLESFDEVNLSNTEYLLIAIAIFIVI